MSQYLSPGVYVEEVPSAIKAIAGVSTSTAGFVGVVPDKIHLLAKDPAAAPGTTKFVDFSLPTPAGTPRLITSWTQFTKAFGDLIGSEAVAATTDPGPAIDTGHRNLAHAVYGFFNNGGSRCYVVRVLSATDFDDALKAFAAIDEIALVAAPGMTDDASRDKLVRRSSRSGNHCGRPRVGRRMISTMSRGFMASPEVARRRYANAARRPVRSSTSARSTEFTGMPASVVVGFTWSFA